MSEDFEIFWAVYPRKIGKALAKKTFIKKKLSYKTLNKILLAVEQQKQLKQWQESKYIPHASTWLNQERWEDVFDPDDFIGLLDGLVIEDAF